MSDERQLPAPVVSAQPERPPEAAQGCRSPAPASPHSPPLEPAASGAGPRCGSGPDPVPVYALGQLGCDFGSEARRDAFLQNGCTNPHDTHALLAFLNDRPWEALGLTWTLSQEATPIYAIVPQGPFAEKAHELLRQFLGEQARHEISQVSIPGRQFGQVTLMNGQSIPALVPDVRRMNSWTAEALIEAVQGPRPAGDAADYDKVSAEIKNFLERVYFELRNVGVTPQDRALNCAASNLQQVADIYRDAHTRDLKLERIEVERSSICRQNSDCWDVKLTLFNPALRLQQAKEVYRLTVDVSEVIPVTIGKLRHWSTF
jgi:cyanobactin maturation PatA/PatG family protease